MDAPTGDEVEQEKRELLAQLKYAVTEVGLQPLLTRQLQRESGESHITIRSSKHVQRLCTVLELIFRHGLKPYDAL